jgi:hypothetical protein
MVKGCDQKFEMGDGPFAYVKRIGNEYTIRKHPASALSAFLPLYSCGTWGTNKYTLAYSFSDATDESFWIPYCMSCLKRSGLDW